MQEKLSVLFSFLNENRQYNKALQNRYYRSVVLPFSKPEEKIISLLYSIANTQSQPKIDYLACFFKDMHSDFACLKSMNDFVGKMNPGCSISFESIFEGLKEQNGWGEKTSALFVKSIYHLHNGEYDDELKIWDDVPYEICQDDKFYLPVDAVIITIFSRIDNTVKWNFEKINRKLRTLYTNAQMEVWDDLWFWGFITQNGTGDNRHLGWNENKYWVLKESDKDPCIINEIKNKAVEFLSLLQE